MKWADYKDLSLKDQQSIINVWRGTYLNGGVDDPKFQRFRAWLEKYRK